MGRSTIPANLVTDPTTRSLEYAARTATVTGAAVATGDVNFERAAFLDFGAHTDGDHVYTFEQLIEGVWTEMPVDLLDGLGVLDTDPILLEPDGTPLLLNTFTVDDDTRDDLQFVIGLQATELSVRVQLTVSGGPATGLVSGVNILTQVPRFGGGGGQPMDAGSVKAPKVSLPTV